MHIILFEDSRVQDLYPITVGRAAFSISVGSMRLINLAREMEGEIELIARPHIRDILRVDASDAWTPEKGPRKGPILLVNARTAPRCSLKKIWQELLDGEYERGAVILSGSAIAAAVLNEPDMLPPGEIGCAQIQGILQDLKLPIVYPGGQATLLERSCDVVRLHAELMNENLECRIASGDYTEILDGVFVPKEEDARPKIGDYFVADTKAGPIILSQNVQIGPFCFMRGPVYIGPNSKINEHSAIKDNVSISSVCKVGGEVEATTIEPYSNKQHHGFLGHSYLGSWVNLGAGTCNSDLKNSYKEVMQETPAGKFPSQMQFLGCVVGDYSKTAINTSIFTGKTIGACSLAYGFVTTAVPSFVNYARSFGQITEISVELMIATQERMFVRRNVKQRPCDVKLLRDMFELTRCERQLASEPLSL